MEIFSKLEKVVDIREGLITYKPHVESFVARALLLMIVTQLESIVWIVSLSCCHFQWFMNKGCQEIHKLLQ